MTQQQFQKEVMDELRQIEDATHLFFSQADSFIARRKEAQYELEQRKLMDTLDALEAMREVREQEKK